MLPVQLPLPCLLHSRCNPSAPPTCSFTHPAVNRQYEVFPAYDHLLCWEDEIHGGTGPTLAGEPSPVADVAPAAGTARPLAQQRRLQAEQPADSGSAGSGAEPGGPYLFDWEKQPKKLLQFVSAAAGSAYRWRLACGLERRPSGPLALLRPPRRPLPPSPGLRPAAAAAAHRCPARLTCRHLPCTSLPPLCLPLPPEQVLPDLSEERWVYAGTEVFKETGDSAHVWEWDLTGALMR